MASPCELFNQLESKFEPLLRNPDVFLRPQEKLATNLKELTKQLYDFGKSREIINIPSSVALPELIINGFDDEQIWQELELQNNAYDGHFLKIISKLLNCNKKDGNAVTLRENHQTSGRDDDDDAELSESSSNEQSQPDADDEENSDDCYDEDYEKMKKISIFDDDGDAMSDISVEMEKALEKRIALDKENAALSDTSSANDNEGDNGEDVDDNDMQDNLDNDKLSSTSAVNGKLMDATQQNVNAKRRSRPSIVDDKFFKLSQLEEFLEIEDAKAEKQMKKLELNNQDDLTENDTQIDYFQDIPSTDDNEDDDDSDNSKYKSTSSRKLKYADFFDMPDLKHSYKKRRTSSDEEEENDDSGDNDENAVLSDSVSSNEEDANALEDKQAQKSAFEVRQQKLKEKIKALEESNLSEKPWQLRGEASVAGRPENSLLEEHVQFDHMTRQAPLITEETTKKLEDIIIQRIKDQVWDDVERKIKPKEEPFQYKKRLILDQEKSKLSLAEVYEQEFLKQQQSEKPEDEDPEEHREIKKSMALLFSKLDALSNFHFMPKPLAPEVKIVNNLPAIVVEEVAPVSASDAALLAPEEIKDKDKGELKGKTERTDTDRKRERREKKSGQKIRRKQKEAHKKMVSALNPGLGNKYSKAEALKQLQEEGKVTLTDKDAKTSKKISLTSSKSFFTQLQEEVQTSLKMRKTEANKKKIEKLSSASKLKL